VGGKQIVKGVTLAIALSTVVYNKLFYLSFYPAAHLDDDTAPCLPIGSPSLSASLV